MNQVIRQFDTRTARLIHGWSPKLRPWFLTVSFFGLPQLVSPLAAIIALLFWVKGEHSLSLAFGGVLIAMAFCTVLKRSLHRMRPDTELAHTPEHKSYSFPSGHAFGSAVFYGLITYISYNLPPYTGTQNHLAILLVNMQIGVTLLLVGGIGISRIYLRAHYPTDTLGGWLLGGLSLGLIIAITKI